MKEFNLTWKKVVLTILVCIAVKYLLSYVVLSGFARLLVDMEIDHVDRLDVYYGVTDSYYERNVRTSQEILPGKKQRVAVPLSNGIARSVRIDLGRTPGTIKMYIMSFRTYYGDAVTLDYKEISKQFEPNEQVSFEIKDDYLLIVTSGRDPYMTYKGEGLKTESHLIMFFIPLLAAAAFYLLISTVALKNLPAIQHITKKSPSSGKNIEGLDGLRGIGALLVLGEHTGVLRGNGAMGVWIFFTLSGFLLAMPFVNRPENALSFTYMSNFFSRRLKRILPMYYAFLVVMYLFTMDPPRFFRHLLFIQGDGHLWTLPQEMLFYVFFPFIVISIYALLKRGKWAVILFLSFLIWAIKNFLGTDLLSIYSYGTSLEFKGQIFILGVLFAYIYNGFLASAVYKNLNRKSLARWCSVSGFVLLISCIVLSAKVIPALSSFNAFEMEEWFGLFACFLIILTIFSGDSLFGKFMKLKALRAVGIVSFSFYLLHPKAIFFTKKMFGMFFGNPLPGMPTFIVAGIITYCFAFFTYSYIEQPIKIENIDKKEQNTV